MIRLDLSTVLGLNQDDLMAITAIVATTIQGLGNPNVNENPPPPPGPQTNGFKYQHESLRKNRPQSFKGDPDPEVDQN